MGDRAQIKFIFDDDGKCIYFYTHWSGSVLHKILANALKRGKDRWMDEEYLARIVFSEMIKDEVLKDTGYGIGPGKHGDIHTLIKVYAHEQVVKYKDKSYLFEDFVKEFSLREKKDADANAS